MWRTSMRWRKKMVVVEVVIGGMRDRRRRCIRDRRAVAVAGRSRKRLVKKSDDKHSSIPHESRDFDEDDADGEDLGVVGFGRDEGTRGWGLRLGSSSGVKRTKNKGEKDAGGERRKEKKMRRERDGGTSGGRERNRPKLTMKRRRPENDGDGEMKELWDVVAGADSEDDKEGVQTYDDDNFIDYSGVDPADRYGSDHGGASPSHYAQNDFPEQYSERRGWI